MFFNQVGQCYLISIANMIETRPPFLKMHLIYHHYDFYKLNSLQKDPVFEKFSVNFNAIL